MTTHGNSSWSGQHTLIAHALGRIGGKDYTNSKQALTRSYERGFRLFEVDVALTSDGEPVLIHGWTPKDHARLGWDAPTADASAQLSVAAFRGKRVHGKYATMRLSDLRDFLVQHPDTRVLFDVRPLDRAQTREIYGKIASIINDKGLRDRCMAGTYNKEMVEEVRSLGHFSRINLFHAKPQSDTSAELDESFLSFCVAQQVETVTVAPTTPKQILDAFRDSGISPIAFTVNDARAAADLLERGATSVGTDTISPESLKRAGEVYIHELTTYTDSRGNEIVYEGERPPKEVNIRIRGRNNRLTVAKGSRLTRLDVIFDNNNAEVSIGPSRAGIPTAAFRIRAGADSTVRVGKDVSTTRSVFLSATEGTSVIIGDDVMFATNNEVRADDAHAIFDVSSGKRVNPARSVTVGNHVWLARDAVILGGATIGDGSVIGYRSLVTRKVPNNCVAVGAPATVTRRNIAWERPHLDDYPPFKPNATVIEKSKYWNPTEDDSAQPAINHASLLTRIRRKVRKLLS
ncbi:glycerophosphodiester phosphodiesterase family protein [Microbacterium sp. Mu-80]|uniref:Glycerophosphodiester phosphodiesterase family protein n=1 Tax=Microbacterium bandirmense TaxID=3122050 RepID=A0ABU8LHG0_9MICO